MVAALTFMIGFFIGSVVGSRHFAKEIIINEMQIMILQEEVRLLRVKFQMRDGVTCSPPTGGFKQ